MLTGCSAGMAADATASVVQSTLVQLPLQKNCPELHGLMIVTILCTEASSPAELKTLKLKTKVSPMFPFTASTPQARGCLSMNRWPTQPDASQPTGGHMRTRASIDGPSTSSDATTPDQDNETRRWSDAEDHGQMQRRGFRRALTYPARMGQMKMGCSQPCISRMVPLSSQTPERLILTPEIEKEVA